MVDITGEQKTWHKTTLAFTGPDLSETATTFTDYRLDVTFTHSDGTQITVPGFWAADGNASNSGATDGDQWQVHFNAPKEGSWTYQVSFKTGPNIAAYDNGQGTPLGLHGETGSFTISPTDKTGDDFRSKGVLTQSDTDGYLEFANGEDWIKTGVDSPENFLSYAGFDNAKSGAKTYQPHANDYAGDGPTWNGGQGTEIAGAINYLASAGVNSVYFITNNIAGDGRDVMPWTNAALYDVPKDVGTMQDALSRTNDISAADFVTYDVSRLAQWEELFGHMQQKGVNLHMLLQETENDQLLTDTALGTLPGSTVSVEFAIYLRELVARFGHHNAITYNLGEENTNTTEERIDLADYLNGLDPYDHLISLHTYPGQDDSVYTPLLGAASSFDGASIQTGNTNQAHDRILEWVNKSKAAGEPWVVMGDEVADASVGAHRDDVTPGHNEVRSEALWGTLMAGGAGVEWYMGYSTGQTDLSLQDFRSRDNLYQQSEIARDFFQKHLPFTEMESMDSLFVKPPGGEGYVLAKTDEVYIVYTEDGEDGVTLDLAGASGEFVAYWFDPYEGGLFELASVQNVQGGSIVDFGTPPASIIDNRVTDQSVRDYETRIEDAVLVVKNVDADLKITAAEVVGGQLAPGDMAGGVGPGEPIAPIATNDTASTFVGQAVVIQALANDRDPDGSDSGLAITGLQGVANGTASIVENGLAISFAPEAGFSGPEVFTYTVTDEQGLTAMGEVTVTVTPDGTGETIDATYYLVDTETDQNIVEVQDGDVVDAALVAGRTVGLYTITGGNNDVGKVTLSLNGAETRTESVSPYALYGDTDSDFLPGKTFGEGTYAFEAIYQTDGNQVIDTEVITFSIAETPGSLPDLQDVAVTIEEDAGQFAVTLSASDFGLPADASPLYFLQVDDVDLGEVTLGGEGSILFFTPSADANGVDEFTVTLWDQQNAGATVSATVSVTIEAVNDAPTGAPTAVLANGREDTDYLVAAADLLQGFSDVDSPSLNIANLAASDGATITDKGNDTFTISPAAGFSGGLTLTYDVTDGDASLAGQTRNVTFDAADDPASSLVAAINIGSDQAFTAADGTVFAADTTGIGNRYSSNGEIGGTEDDMLFTTEAWSPNGLSYDVAVTDGDYAVTLYFAEIWSGANASGKRQFDIELEGAQVADNFDVFAESGGAREAIAETYNVAVNDGVLDIDLLKQVQNPKLSGLKIERLEGGLPDPAPQPEPPALSEAFGLVDTDTDQIIAPLGADTIIDAGLASATRLGVATDAANRGNVESVGYSLDGEAISTENVAPYALFGDISGDFKDGRFFEAGDYTLQADYFSSNSLAGDALGSDEIKITVADSVFDAAGKAAVFIFETASMGADVITGFGEDDQLVFTDIADTSAVLADAQIVNGDTVLDFGGDNVLLLRNYTWLSEDNFVA